MLMLLSPAKALDFESKCPIAPVTYPIYQNEMKPVLERCQQLSVDDLAQLMKISDKLSLLNYNRFQNWQLDDRQGKNDQFRQAIFAFNGDVYDGLSAKTLNDKALQFAQQHLRILSGLYGLLRPLDLIQPYRLEMGSALAIGKAKNLYAFWQNILTQQINQLLEEEKSLLNLASQEYFKVIDKRKLIKPVVEVVFLDQKEEDSPYKIISFYAKKARGLMARFIIQNELNDFKPLKEFKVDGYQFDFENSTESTLFFKRSAQNRC